MSQVLQHQARPGTPLQVPWTFHSTRPALGLLSVPPRQGVTTSLEKAFEWARDADETSFSESRRLRYSWFPEYLEALENL